MITYAALSPHPPVIIPEVGRERIHQAEVTIRGMQTMARELVRSEPDTVIFLTPHGNVFSDCISCLLEPQLSGDLGAFGSPEVKSSHPNDLELVKELGKRAEAKGISFLGINQAAAQRHRLNVHLDHGILVPLYYLEKAGLGPTSIVAISVGYLEKAELYAMGKLIQEVADQLGRRVAIVASGDMSHRLKNEGPYDFHPDGPRFDLMIEELLSRGDVQGIMKIPDKLRENAGECGYMSIIIMLGSLDSFEIKPQIFSYEGPFGVGYMTAGLIPGSPRASLWAEMASSQSQIMADRRQTESLPVRWARLTLEGYLQDGHLPELPAEMQTLTQDTAGAFVSLKKNGQLRGCIGTFLPAYENLAQEIRHNALAAGLKDPRFPAVEVPELPSLVYSVDVLAQPEAATKEQLDPKKYGVIVSHGSRRGLLLPDLEGVDTVDDQLQIALQKGGIAPEEKYSIQRFEVKRYT
ncbi:MAG: AmmeMemoRadiSam system protein A [Firmicutes bacterium]|nr:AmmeMemoRadiSam system protein A [Bacillota bacterium]